MKIASFFICFLMFFSLFATVSVNQFPYTREVFESLSKMPAHSIPGMTSFRFGENFYFSMTDETECRNIPARGIVQKISDYLELLNEMERATYDLRLFNRQMSQILGDGSYLMCQRQFELSSGKRTDVFFFSHSGDYRLWLTEVVE